MSCYRRCTVVNYEQLSFSRKKSKWGTLHFYHIKSIVCPVTHLKRSSISKFFCKTANIKFFTEKLTKSWNAIINSHGTQTLVKRNRKIFIFMDTILRYSDPSHSHVMTKWNIGSSVHKYRPALQHKVTFLFTNFHYYVAGALTLVIQWLHCLYCEVSIWMQIFCFK